MNITRNRKFSMGVIALIGVCLVFGISTLYSADDGYKLLNNFKSFEPRVPLIPEGMRIDKEFMGGVEKRVGTLK